MTTTREAIGANMFESGAAALGEFISWHVSQTPEYLDTIVVEVQASAQRTSSMYDLLRAERLARIEKEAPTPTAPTAAKQVPPKATSKAKAAPTAPTAAAKQVPPKATSKAKAK